MKSSLSTLAVLLAASTVLADPKIEVYFSPKGGCTEAVVDALSKAKATVLVQAYSFTSPAISKALVEAQRRGVKIQVILDKSNRTDRYSNGDVHPKLRHPDVHRRPARHRAQQNHHH